MGSPGVARDRLGGALRGLLVLDLTRNAPGPFCAMLLADFGAEVIRIADPAFYRAAVRTGNAYFDLRGQPHDGLGRGKRSIGLNLKTPGGLEVFLRLARRADVLVEEMRPGVAKRLGIDYATLSEENPGLVYCSITGYGQDGPRAMRAGHDLNYLGYSGFLDLIRDRTGAPVVPPNVFADFAAGGTLAALGIACAVIARSRTGRGQHVDAAMMEGVSYLMCDYYSVLLGAGESPRGGDWSTTGGLPFYSVYETKDAKHLTVAACEHKFFERLCHLLGCAEYASEQWNSASYEGMRAAFSSEIHRRTRDEWMSVFEREDACVGPVYTFAEAIADPQAVHRRVIDEDLTQAAGYRGVSPAPRLSATPATIRRAPPTPFAHTETVLEELGYSQAEIESLSRAGAIATGSIET